MNVPLGGQFPKAPKVPLRDPDWWYPQALALSAGFEETAVEDRARQVWLDCHAADLVLHDAAHLACCHFDGCLAHGTPQSVKLLQQVAQVPVTGRWTPEILAGVERIIGMQGEAPVVFAYLQARRTLGTGERHLARLTRFCIAHLGQDWYRPADWALPVEVV